jgi:serine/threonine protein kinase
MPDPRPLPRRRDRYQARDLIGEKYVLVRPLGSGGMGAVWVAHDRVLDVHVAVKLLTLESDSTDAYARRMLEEARTAARLDHSAIVRTLEFGVTRHGDPYLATELLHGEDLAERLTRQRSLPALEAVTTLLPIAHGLAVAHDAGIVHRDVKPENIFLQTTDLGLQPKLLDFGIARFTDRAHRLTMEGVVLGTPDYLAPEQARGEQVTASADLWSFCVVLYELVSGVCPFTGAAYYELLRAIVEEEPTPLSAHGVDEPELWTILEGGLRKRAADRPRSMRELGQRLAAWALARGAQEDVTGTALRRTWLRDADPPRTGADAALAAGSSPRGGAGAAGPTNEPVTGPGPLSASGQGPASTPGSFPGEEAATDAALAALAAVSELGDPDDRFARASRTRHWAVAAVLVGLVALGALLVLASAGLLFADIPR